MDSVSKLYEELISFSDLYDSASFEAKKMIVNQLIRRVDVYRGYISSTLPSTSTLRRTLKRMMQQPAEKPGGKHSFLKMV